MPRLPGFESLGGNQTDATRPTGSYDVSPLARGGQAIAQGVETLGRGVSKVGDDVAEVLRKHNQSLFLNAHANIASGLANLNTSFVGDKDYATLQQRYNDQAQALIKQNAETIPPGNYRTHFLATANELVAHGGTAIAHQAYGGIVKADDDQLKLELDKATDDINKNPGNPMRGAQIDALGLRVDNAVNNGWKTPEEGDLLKRDIAIKTRMAELQLLTTHGIVPNPDFAVRPKAGEQEDAIMRASARSGIPEDTLRNIAKPSPIDSSINPMMMYHFNAVATSAEIRRQNDEARINKQRLDTTADDIVLGRTVPAVAGATGAINAPAAVRYNNPGAMWMGPTAARWGATSKVDLPGGNNIAVFSNPVNGAAAHIDLLRSNYAGMTLHDAINKWSGGNSATAYTDFVAKSAGISSDTVLTRDILSGPTGVAIAKAQAVWEAGRASPITDEQWHQASEMVSQGAPPASMAEPRAAAGATNAVITETGVQPGSATQQAQAASMAQQRAAAMQEAYSHPNAKTDEDRMYLMQKVKNRFDLMQVATNQTENERKEIINHAADQYTQRIWDGLHTPGFDFQTLAGEINHDPALEGAHEIREKLMERVVKYSGEEKPVTYGSGFMDVKGRVLSAPGTPGHIASMADVYLLPSNMLTSAGEKEIGNIIGAVKKSPDEAALQKAKAGMEQYAKLTMSRERDLGPVKLADPKGELKFHGDFLPQFNAAYSKWVSDGNDPWKFLEKDNVNKFIDRVYPPKERSMDALNATAKGEGEAPEAPNAPLPPPPEGIEASAWTPVVSAPPMTAAGTPVSHAKWAEILEALVKDPSEEAIKEFNESKLGKISGYDAKKLLKMLNPNSVWEPQGGKEFPTGAAEVPGESFSETPPGVGGVPFGEGMGLAAESKASPKEMSEFQKQQQDPNNPAVRFRKFLEMGMHPENVKEKRHPEEER